MAASAQGMDTHVTSTMTCSGPDDVLVIEAIGGNSRSFEMLVRRYQRLIVALGHRMTGNRTDAEDIAQQTFMKAFLGLQAFERRCSFSTWLTSIAINEARMWKRKQSRLREVTPCGMDSEDTNTPFFEFADSRPDPESSCSERERRAVLFSRITHLNATLRSAVEACDLLGESNQTAALLLGITATAVKSRRHRGRAILRSALAPYRS
jgi:RNA polymerase sigma-70 factor (ECF subfamily)